MNERGGASLIVLTFALLLIGVSALGASEIAQLASRRAEIRKIEALALAAMARAGGSAPLACQMVSLNSSITCEFGGGEILLRGEGLPPIPVGWQEVDRSLGSSAAP